MKYLGIYILLLFSIFSLKGQVYEIASLPINTRFSEFSPSFYSNGIVFCSDRKNHIIKTVTDEKSGNYLADLFQWFPLDSINSKAAPFSDSINTLFNEGPLTFCNYDSVIYYTRNQHLFKKPKEIERKKNNLGIFTARKTATGWTKIIASPYNNESYSIAHPSITADGKTIYFVSDMPGGMGGTDIYRCELQNNIWSKPENLGNSINSKYNELFPFIHPQNTLFFSSNRPNGTGGLDIYSSALENEKKWSIPKLLDTTINSEADDYGYIVNSNFQSGYFTSNRNGNDDIYSFTFSFPEFENPDSIRSPELCFDLHEENALLTDSMPLEYEWEMGDGTKLRGPSISHCYEKPGEYVINLNVINTVSGEVFYNDASYDLFIEDVIQPKIIASETSHINEEILFLGEIGTLPNLNNLAFYWKIDESSKYFGKNICHKFPKLGTFRVLLLVQGTDSLGEEKNYCVFKDVIIK